MAYDAANAIYGIARQVASVVAVDDDKLSAFSAYDASSSRAVDGDTARIEAFVKLFGNVEGLCHVSRLGWGYVNRASDVVKVGDKLRVRVIEIDDHGKVKVSAKEFMEKPEGFQEEGRKLEHHDRPDKSIKGPRKFRK